MEPSSSPIPDQQPKRTPWGTIIGIVLILAVVVASAFYSFTKRYEPAHTPPTTLQS